MGVVATCPEKANGWPVASGLSWFVPPQRNSSSGRTSSKGGGGSVQVGAVPRPAQVPLAQRVYSGQSHSSSQLQPVASAPESSQVLVK